jgi:hypothetical protein
VSEPVRLKILNESLRGFLHSIKKSWPSPGPAKVAVLATFADQRYRQMARKSAETARFGRIPQRKTRFSGM